MKNTASLTALAGLIFAGASYATTQLEFPESFPLHKRQDVEPGTPRYDCHAACGGVITVSRTDNFCANPDYDAQLAACLKCANTFAIWPYYGRSVGAAAAQCSDDATPSPSGFTDVPEATPEPSAPASEEPTPGPAPTATVTATTEEETAVTSAPATLATEIIASTLTLPGTTSGASAAPTPPAFTGAASPLGSDSVASFIAVLLGLSGFLL